MAKKLPTYTDLYLKELTSGELGDDMYDNNGDRKFDVITNDPNKVSGWDDAESMPIEDAIKILTALKRGGANRISFFYHTDHQEHHFFGIRRYLTTVWDRTSARIADLKSNLENAEKSFAETKTRQGSLAKTIKETTEELEKLLKKQKRDDNSSK